MSRYVEDSAAAYWRLFVQWLTDQPLELRATLVQSCIQSYGPAPDDLGPAIRATLEEKDDASQEGQEQEDSQPEHSDARARGQAAEAGGSHRAEQGRQESEEAQEEVREQARHPQVLFHVDMVRLSKGFMPVLSFAGVEIWAGVEQVHGKSLMLWAKGGPTYVRPGGSWLPVPGTGLRVMIPAYGKPGDFLLEEADWRDS